MRLFTYMDYANGVCTAGEIDMPWEARWSKPDMLNGLCGTDDIGRPKQPESNSNDSGEQQQQSAKPFKPLTNAERKRLLVEMSDKLLIEAHSSPAAFAGDSGPQINKFIDAAQRLLLEDHEAPHLAELTQQKLRSIPVVERYMSMIAPVLALPDEQRQAVLDSWGMTQEVIDQLLKEMQDAL